MIGKPYLNKIDKNETISIPEHIHNHILPDRASIGSKSKAKDQ